MADLSPRPTAPRPRSQRTPTTGLIVIIIFLPAARGFRGPHRTALGRPLPPPATGGVSFDQETFMARTTATVHVPLGSLTQRGARQGAGCRACGSERVTTIAMALTDGSPVEFTSCHRCEHRTWQEQGTTGKVLPVQHVLDKTRKPR
jgi:hypothetical protein